MVRIPLICLFTLIASDMSSAASPVDPRSASLFQILGGKGVKKYIAERQAELEQLHGRIASLDDSLLKQLGALHILEQKASDARARTSLSQAEIDDLRTQIASEKSQAQAAYDRAAELNDKAALLKAKTADARRKSAGDKADAAEVAALREEVKELEDTSRLLNRAITRTLNNREASRLDSLNEGR